MGGHPKTTKKEGEMKVWVGCARGVQVAYVTLHHRGCTLVPPSTWAKRVPRVGCALRSYLPTPGWGVEVCVCLCALFACTPPLLAWVCGVGVGASARVSAAPRNYWLGCWGVCVFVCALRLYPATPGWFVRWGCVCLGSGFGCAPPHLAGVLGCVCVCVRALLVPRHS